MLIRAIRAIWDEPSAADASGPGRRDVMLVAMVLVAATVEASVRSDLVWPLPSWVVVVVGAVALPWRRVAPLAAAAIAVGLGTVVHLAALFRDVEWDGLGTAVVFVLLPYAVGRWGSGRHGIGGAALFALTLSIAAVAGAAWVDVLGGMGVVALAAAVGAVVRFRMLAQRQQLDSLRARERAELARELHDSVAHHVTAIAVQAQAGRTLIAGGAAPTDRVIAEVLAVIEDQASRSLDEMRSLVGALRDTERAGSGPGHEIGHIGADDLAPALGIRDLEQLGVADGLPLVVERSGSVDDLNASVDAAVYRLVREAVTNARRHAVGATSVTVRVDGGDDTVRLTVADDGRAAAHRSGAGFGLVGMAERVELLGGSFDAGPSPAGGWSVVAELPRRGLRR